MPRRSQKTTGIAPLPLLLVLSALVAAAAGGYFFLKQNGSLLSNQPRQQTPKAKLDTHELPELLNIEVKTGVDQEDETKMREGFKIMDFYLNEWFGKSITKKSLIRIDASSRDSKFLQEKDTTVFLFSTISQDWQLPKQISNQYKMDMSTRAAAHEYVHLYQINQGCANVGRTNEKLKWLIEGEAEWLSWKAMEESGSLPFYFKTDQILPQFVKQAGNNLKPLKTYEKEAPTDPAIYSYFTLALNQLTKDKEPKILADYCVNISKGEEASKAFENAFDISLDQFYKDFDIYYQDLINPK